VSERSGSVSVSLFGLWWCIFVAIKLAGHSLAAWSWWWTILPIVPLLGLIVQRFGL
jgi:hypothetical protein